MENRCQDWHVGRRWIYPFRSRHSWKPPSAGVGRSCAATGGTWAWTIWIPSCIWGPGGLRAKTRRFHSCVHGFFMLLEYLIPCNRFLQSHFKNTHSNIRSCTRRLAEASWKRPLRVFIWRRNPSSIQYNIRGRCTAIVRDGGGRRSDRTHNIFDRLFVTSAMVISRAIWLGRACPEFYERNDTRTGLGWQRPKSRTTGKR